MGFFFTYIPILKHHRFGIGFRNADEIFPQKNVSFLEKHHKFTKLDTPFFILKHIYQNTHHKTRNSDKKLLFSYKNIIFKEINYTTKPTIIFYQFSSFKLCFFLSETFGQFFFFFFVDLSSYLRWLLSQILFVHS